MDMDMIVDMIELLEKKGVSLQLSVEGEKTVEVSVKNKKIDVNIVNPTKIGKLIKDLNLM